METLVALYVRRWRVELYFDDIKTTMHAATMRSTADLRPGDHVIAVGHPFGIGSTSMRELADLERLYQRAQADALLDAGVTLADPARVDATLAEAKAIAKAGRPVCINVHLRKTDFRKGSISI